MAVTTQNGTEYESVFNTSPPAMLNTTDWHGRMRLAYFKHTQSGAGDATSSARIVKLPPGRVRLLLPASHVYVNWTTASATLDMGWEAYNDLEGDAVAADYDGLIDGADVDAAGVLTQAELCGLAGLAATGNTKLFESRDGVVIRLTSQDTAIANADYAAGYLVYVQD